MSVNSDENDALKIPPKIALHEDLNLNEMDLDIRKSGVKLRWHLWALEENDNQPGDVLEEVKKTS